MALLKEDGSLDNEPIRVTKVDWLTDEEKVTAKGFLNNQRKKIWNRKEG